nr:uncharacterized protein LOC113398299 [Vanessa tameamea]
MSKNTNSEGRHENMITEQNESTYGVCITSLQVLPKQMALAKLLFNEQINKIVKIKYKNLYKVIIQFEDKQYAQKLLTCKKLIELQCRMQMMDENNLSFGVIRGIEKELSEEELKELIVCPYEITSVKRLKRLFDNKWEDSETITVCFASPTLPPYVEAYGCRFKVESFTFQVTQCSRCWKFGHPKKFCPSNKIICPKCGNNHDNCDTTSYKCINCKGSHITLNKTCPVYLREKRLREIMSNDNVNYKKAIQIYQNQYNSLSSQLMVNLQPIEENHYPIQPKNTTTYSEVLKSPVLTSGKTLVNKQKKKKSEEKNQSIV